MARTRRRTKRTKYARKSRVAGRKNRRRGERKHSRRRVSRVAGRKSRRRGRRGKGVRIPLNISISPRVTLNKKYFEEYCRIIGNIRDKVGKKNKKLYLQTKQRMKREMRTMMKQTLEEKQEVWWDFNEELLKYMDGWSCQDGGEIADSVNNLEKETERLMDKHFQEGLIPSSRLAPHNLPPQRPPTIKILNPPSHSTPQSTLYRDKLEMSGKTGNELRHAVPPPRTAKASLLPAPTPFRHP
jgi:hypothetical protein